jgi:NADH-quinone oxidoreductase subunit L
MGEFEAVLVRLAVVKTLGVIVLPPIVAALVLLALSWVAAKRTRPLSDDARTRDENTARAIAVGAVVVSLGATLYHVYRLIERPASERYLLQHAFRLVRIGQLDASFDLAFDPLAAVMALVVTFVGALIFAYAARYMRGDPGYVRFFAYLSFFVGAMLVLVLADNLLLMFFGSEGVGVASYGLIGFYFRDPNKAAAGTKAFLVNRVGDFGFVVGTALLFWGLGGVWSGGDYTPDLSPRIEAVTARDPGTSRAKEAPARPTIAIDEEGNTRPLEPALPPSIGGRGFVTLTSFPGAIVFMDESRVPMLDERGEPLRSPFVRVPVPGGYHTFRVHAGDGLDDSIVRHVAVGDDREVVLTLVGPTLTFREIGAQLALESKIGSRPVLDTLRANVAFSAFGVPFGLVTVAVLCFLLAAAGKSAQVPLYVWLPDAMAGPTPVSALIHAATMVTAGVYLLARLHLLVALSPAACAAIATVGIVTALYAALRAFYQTDLKRILAFSTVSQLGLMFVGVGVGAFSAALFHLVTHALFKACLFLAAGSVIHGMHALETDETSAQDIRKMGGLRAVMPKTARAYAAACVAISGAPIPFFAGFWSKDDILVGAATTTATAFVSGTVFFALGLVVSACTSFYMWRSYFLVFGGKPAFGRSVDAVHESPAAMTMVLDALAALSAVAGLVLGFSTHMVGGDGHALLEEWLQPVFAGARLSPEPLSVVATWQLLGLGFVAGVVGYLAARRRYGQGRGEAWYADEARSKVHGWLTGREPLDALYARAVVRPVVGLGSVLVAIDRWVVDSIVHGVALLVRAVAWAEGWLDQHVVDGAVDGLANATLRLCVRARALQTGRVQTYVLVAFASAGLLLLAHYVLFAG